MAADSVNRQTVRDAFATLLGAAIAGSGKPAQVLYGYKVGKVDQTPTVVVASGSTRRQLSGMNDTRWRNLFTLEVFTFVRDAVEVNASWTEQDVENMLDLLDKTIADVIADNRVNSHWSFINLADAPSEIITDTERGYVIEMRRIEVTYIEG